MPAVDTETETHRVREIFESSAAGYDREIRFFERLSSATAGGGSAHRLRATSWRSPSAPVVTCPSIPRASA